MASRLATEYLGTERRDEPVEAAGEKYDSIKSTCKTQ